VDTSSDRVVAETEYNPHHLALSALTPDGHTGYALYTPAAYGTSTSAITVFDVDKGTVRRTLPLAGAGRMLALSPETGVICVASIDGPVLAVQIVDSGSGIVLGTATAVGADTILDIAVAPHTSTAYVLSTSGPVGTVSVFDVEERSAVGQINVGRLPTGIVFAPDGRHAYVVNEGSGTISVIDTATRTLAVDIPVGMDPLGAAVGPDAAYVIRKNSRDIGVIDLGTYRVVRTVSLDRYPVGVGYSAASRRLYVFTATGEVQVLDPVSLRPAGSPAAPAV
jgi:YVTN family beta-propeller protein